MQPLEFATVLVSIVAGPGIAVTLVFSDKPRIHEILAILFTLGCFVAIGLFSFRLGANQF